jgi:hypothetical protein
VRTEAEIRHEIAYWQTILAELTKANLLILEVAEEIVEIPILALEALTLSQEGARSSTFSRIADATGQIQTRARESLRLLQELQGPVSTVAELAGGRGHVLEAEIRGDEAVEGSGEL